jgi:23S rRNA (cytosine1962-C5)-methyltransferase
MNRARAAAYVKGKRVLDVFSYLGAWGVQAAAAGAESVLCVDSSALALEGVARNAQLNQVEAKVQTRQADAFDLLKELRAARERYDVVILDPPALNAPQGHQGGTLLICVSTRWPCVRCA